MTVWIVNPFDNLPPEGLRPQRYWLMARAFARAGHKVEYWSADFSHAYKQPRDPARLIGVHEGIKLLLAHEPPYPRNICFKRLWSHWRFSRNWLSEALKGEKGVDVVIVSSPPLSLAAAARAFCRQTGARLILDIQDDWPGTFRRVAPGFLLAPLAALARRNYLAADAITAVSRRYLEMARSLGASCPMHLCYHGIENRQVPAARGDALPPSPGSKPDACRLVYVGNMSRSYDLATVVEAVKVLPDATLELAGTGPDEAALRSRAAGCGRIRFHGYLEEGPLRELLARSDIGIVPMFPDSCVGIPGKLADYAAAGLPIINSLGGEAEELLARYGAGVRYEAGSRESFLAAVQAARHLEKNAVFALSVEFDAEKLYNSYLNFIESVASKPGPAGA
ncbi:MAG: glycosyltransferase family 4 protein [Kiritimatiellae bacterium]|nr:glycosyltransferase family 4 protein [Kiritimatiellia bacterium]